MGGGVTGRPYLTGSGKFRLIRPLEKPREEKKTGVGYRFTKTLSKDLITEGGGKQKVPSTSSAHGLADAKKIFRPAVSTLGKGKEVNVC